MRLKKAITYWLYSFCLSFIIVVSVQNFILKDHYQLNYIGGFLLSAFVDFLVIIGLYDNIPSKKTTIRLNIIKKLYKNNGETK